MGNAQTQNEQKDGEIDQAIRERCRRWRCTSHAKPQGTTILATSATAGEHRLSRKLIDQEQSSTPCTNRKETKSDPKRHKKIPKFAQMKFNKARTYS
jgi:hypothetical protein